MPRSGDVTSAEVRWWCRDGKVKGADRFYGCDNKVRRRLGWELWKLLWPGTNNKGGTKSKVVRLVVW